MKAVIVSGGTPPSLKLIQEELKNSSLLICADSGGNCLLHYNICPDYLIGDFDSISNDALQYFKDKCLVEKYPVNKDFTDTQLALKKAITLGSKEVVFLGCTGSRLDHTFGNIGLLYNCLTQGIYAEIRDDNNTIFLASKGLHLSGVRGEKFSLLAYNQTIHNLSIHNCKYPLLNYKLELGDPLTLSNEFLEGEAKIEFKEGSPLLIMMSKD